MAEDKKAAAEQPKKAAGPAPLGDAGSSSDPRVHDLLAQREIAVRNEDKAAVEALTAQLADLGVA